MMHIFFDYSASLIKHDELAALGARLRPEVERVMHMREKGYETDYASVNVPFDQDMLASVKHTIENKKSLNPTILVVIGIGGSNLGTIALHQAINGLMYNQKNPPLKIYFVDTVDADYVSDIYQLVEQELQQESNVLLNVVTKSGSTTETIANFEIFLELLQKYHSDDYHNYVVATTNVDSKLWNYAGTHNIDRLAVPARVGGRYSVFSAVGLFPLGMLGVDVDQLCAGAQQMVDLCTGEFEQNGAAIGAALIYYHYQQGKNIHDMFLFGPELEALGKWYRQLMGESVGKKIDAGITPTVSVGSTDLHSVAQLYLGGPYDKFSALVTVEKNKTDISVPKRAEFDQLAFGIQGVPLHKIMQAIITGVKTAYQKNKRPFCSIVLPEKSAFYLGEFMQMQMLQMIYLGYLLEVNPFDQPHVELYKQETRKILANE